VEPRGLPLALAGAVQGALSLLFGPVALGVDAQGDQDRPDGDGNEHKRQRPMALEFYVELALWAR
jgi:hypothetical protein